MFLTAINKINNNGETIDIPDNNSFKFKHQLTAQTENSEKHNVEEMVPLKCLSNFWRILEMPLINCEISWNGLKTVL